MKNSWLRLESNRKAFHWKLGFLISLRHTKSMFISTHILGQLCPVEMLRLEQRTSEWHRLDNDRPFALFPYVCTYAEQTNHDNKIPHSKDRRLQNKLYLDYLRY